MFNYKRSAKTINESFLKFTRQIGTVVEEIASQLEQLEESNRTRGAGFTGKHIFYRNG
ncbi:hypothetical protein [Petroclostridium xylanilyticum]|uniref:hypothetical protein n=1 Tax=Petroclostridium xylanilyticum TaxID=1792311 RepID=UPI0018E3DC8B|nr:hypothetical protein [Petroclostridium xylanilyticum]